MLILPIITFLKRSVPYSAAPTRFMQGFNLVLPSHTGLFFDHVINTKLYTSPLLLITNKFQSFVANIFSYKIITILMFSTQFHTHSGISVGQSHLVPSNTKPTNAFQLSSSKKSKVMWRSISQRVYLKIPPSFCLDSLSYRRNFNTLLAHSANPLNSEKLPLRAMKFDCSSPIKRYPERNSFEMGQIFAIGVGSQVGYNVKRYASVAEAVVSSSTDADDEINGGDEVQTLLSEMGKENQRQAIRGWWRQKRAKTGSSWNYMKLKRRQVKIETEAWELAAKEYRELLSDMCEQKLAPNLPYMKSLFLGWFEPFSKKIEQDQELCRTRKHKTAYAPYFDLLPADKMAVITMHKVMGLIMTGGENGCARVVSASCSVGEAIEQEIRIHKFLEKTKTKKASKAAKSEEKASDDVIKEQEGLHKKVTNLMKRGKLQVVGHIVKGHDDSKAWTQAIKAQVGSRLIELLMQSAFIQPPADQFGDMPPDVRPAFMHKFRTSVKEGQKNGRRYGVIECDPSVRKGLERASRHVVIPYMPMLIPPVKWTGYDKGAYLFLPSYIMRTHGAKQQREVLKNTPKENMHPVFEALDTLGNTKWRVNKRVLSVVDRIWGNGGCLADLVDRKDIPLPEKPDTEDEEELKRWKWKVKKVMKENRERHSQRCDVELKLTVARKMKDEAGFFYPHNLDFRGRAYPMPPHLNHLGSDLCRGILEFAEGRALGNSGLRWLKIHLANLYAGGVDKLPLEGRIDFTETHLDDVFDSADKPLDGGRWWLKAEDPFQCLAVCINLAEALRSPSPETVVSYIPVHQDGSCNGLQHYAALGRDKLGASAVNLVEGERPADVYSEVAVRVRDVVERDAKLDPASFPDAKHAQLLINQVDRKLVKQTVMTSVYGVTFIGARDQIFKRLQERSDINADDSQLFMASCYVTKIVLAKIGEVFEGARNIMNWLGDCAKLVASENHPVRWTTPLGLPVVQPYRMYGRHLVSTSLQVLTLQRETEKVMVRRQRTAFPPNFVHSLDGSHMMMTAVACKHAGLNFAGVHDSYWTHACNVDEMNRILREKFVELYQTPILENLLESFQESFPDLSFPPLPDRGDFDLSDVLESSYFFN